MYDTPSAPHPRHAPPRCSCLLLLARLLLRMPNWAAASCAPAQGAGPGPGPAPASAGHLPGGLRDGPCQRRAALLCRASPAGLPCRLCTCCRREAGCQVPVPAAEARRGAAAAQALATRACYLFCRMVKTLRGELQPHLAAILRGLQPHLAAILASPRAEAPQGTKQSLGAPPGWRGVCCAAAPCCRASQPCTGCPCC